MTGMEDDGSVGGEQWAFSVVGGPVDGGQLVGWTCGVELRWTVG